MRVQDIMTRPVTTVRPETTVREAATLLAVNGFTALPVVTDEDEVVGILTEMDVMRNRIQRDPRSQLLREPSPDQPPPATVGDVMSSPALTMPRWADVAEIVKVMIDRGVRSIPVTDGARLVGIVTRRDVVRTLTRDDATIEADVRHRLEIYGGFDRWSVRVRQGVVTIGDVFDDPTDEHVARVLAQAVPGVTHVEIHRPQVGQQA
ncbi:CBS domain-containing protein [Streptoalloteichus hindustanus]|uniref:CBS domain-containing protein n=1 Tax=Streptoalloteichus hindustanus TaxID=2017 RepID=A0A1M5DS98_STRHI|nr:CBS domain-containing protein [Streptoalloteichus hindustanus]SHF69806.1 CBS domain-containing protein [Streptoalloteichus hindustanus]